MEGFFGGGDGGGGGNLLGKLHPLQIQVVVKEVIGLCGALGREDLYNFRQVSSAWNQETLKMWRECAWITLVKEKRKEGDLLVAEFMELYDRDEQKLRSLPFFNYKFKYWNLDERIPLPPNCEDVKEEGEASKEASQSHSRRFWDEIGPLIRRLHFDECYSTEIGAKGFQDIAFRELMNLQELKLSRNTFTLPEMGWLDSQENQNSLLLYENLSLHNLISIDLEGLLPYKAAALCQWLPNLQKIRLDDCKVSDDDWRKLYAAGWPWMQRQQTIKHADVFLSRYDNHFRRSILQGIWSCVHGYKTLGFQLDHFVEDQLFTAFTVAGILGKNDNVLEKLIIFRKPFSDCPLIFAMITSKMSVLTEFTVWGNVVADFKFLTMMPQLRRLHMNQNCYELREELKVDLEERGRKVKRFLRNMFSPILGPLPEIRMEYLQYFYCDVEFSTEEFRQLGRFFPVLEELHVRICSWAFLVICEQWGGLKKMGLLYGSRVKDEVVCQGLASLGKLEQFSLECECNSGLLTDRAVHEGFLKLPKLQSVRICVSPELSEAAEELLKDRICSVRIIRNYGEGHKEECCIRSEFEREFVEDDVSVLGLFGGEIGARLAAVNRVERENENDVEAEAEAEPAHEDEDRANN